MLQRALRATLVLSTVGLVACHTATRLEGHWKGRSADGVDPDKQAAANAFAQGMELDVKGDKIVVVYPKGDAMAGKFSIDKTTTKEMLVLYTEKDGPEDKQTFTFVDDNTVKWKVNEGKAITFE